MFWKIDRLARSLIGIVELMRDAQKQGVSLVSVEDPFDLSSPHGLFQAQLLALFAELERPLISARISNTRKHLLKTGRWTGGRHAYGLKPAPNPSGPGRVLVRDPEAAEIIKEIARRVLDGETITNIADDLNKRGVPGPRAHSATKENPKPSAWAAQGIRWILNSPTVAGRTMDPVTGRLIRENGIPLVAWDPILTPAEQARVLAALPEKGVRKAAKGHHWLYLIAKCATCGGNLAQGAAGPTSTPGIILRCSGPTRKRHPIVSVRADALGEYVNSQVLRCLGPLGMRQREWLEGSDPAADIEQLRACLDELDDDRRAGLFDTAEGKARYRRLYKDAMADLAALEATPVVEAGWRVTGTGESYWEFWKSATPEERGDELRGLGATVTVSCPAVPRARVMIERRVSVDFGELNDAAAEGASITDQMEREAAGFYDD